jgi:hypothetical protein
MDETGPVHRIDPAGIGPKLVSRAPESRVRSKARRQAAMQRRKEG